MVSLIVGFGTGGLRNFVGVILGSIETEGIFVGWLEMEGDRDGNSDGCCESDGLRVGDEDGSVDGMTDG